MPGTSNLMLDRLDRYAAAQPSKNYDRPPATGVNLMLETVAVLLLILWALGLVTSYTLGGLIHILLVVAIVVVLVRVIQGRRI
jgi:hypothetical protein